MSSHVLKEYGRYSWDMNTATRGYEREGHSVVSAKVPLAEMQPTPPIYGPYRWAWYFEMEFSHYSCSAHVTQTVVEATEELESES